MTPEAPEDRRRGSRFSPGPDAGDRDLQAAVGGLPRRQIRSEALAAARRASASLQHRAHESPRRSGGRRAGGPLPDRRAARVRRRAASAASCRRRAASAIFYDVGQGQGWQRNIVMNGSPHLPAEHPPVVRQLARPLGGQYARRRRDEFQPEDRLSGLARESASGRALDAHRSRTRSNTQVTIEDPTVWTQPWTVKQEFTKQSDKENRIYYEPRCIEGNIGFPTIIRMRRAGRPRVCSKAKGPDPATKDNASGFAEEDPLQ